MRPAQNVQSVEQQTPRSRSALVALSVFLEIMSCGFITLADCIALDFDPVCYSVHENQPVEGVDDPMWWPHQDREKDGDG